MTDIEQKALALVNEVLAENGMNNTPHSRLPTAVSGLVLLRAIEQHEAFRQEVSDAVESLCNTVLMSHLHRQLREMLSQRFIIAKPDPLVEVIADYKRTKGTGEYATNKDMAAALRAAIEKRGGKIVWGEG